MVHSDQPLDVADARNWSQAAYAFRPVPAEQAAEALGRRPCRSPKNDAASVECDWRSCEAAPPPELRWLLGAAFRLIRTTSRPQCSSAKRKTS